MLSVYSVLGMRSRTDTSLEKLIEELDESLGKKYNGEEFVSKAEKILDEHDYILGDGYGDITLVADKILQRETTEVYSRGEEGVSDRKYEDTVIFYLRGRSEDQESGAVFPADF